jgi:hypothetical protein
MLSTLLLQEAQKKGEYSPQSGSHPGELPVYFRAIANSSELFRSLDKPQLATLPFFVGY